MVIIGIVSAITISNLISNTQKQEYVTRLKKADSVLRQSLYNIAAKSGYPIGDFSFMQNDDFFKSFKEEVNVIKVCDSEHRGCFSETAKALNSKNWKNYDYGANGQINTLITNDGISYNYVSGTICF